MPLADRKIRGPIKKKANNNNNKNTSETVFTKG